MADINKLWVFCMFLTFLQAIQIRSLQQNVEQLDAESDSIQQAWTIIEKNMKQQYDIPQDQTMIQTGSENEFLGTALWDFFDLVTFGAFEKKPKKHNENNSTQNSNSTQQATPQTVTKEVKVIENKDRAPQKQQSPPQNAQQQPPSKQPEQPIQVQNIPDQQPVQPKTVAKSEPQQVEPEVKYSRQPDVTQGPGDHPNHKENQDNLEKVDESVTKQIDSTSTEQEISDEVPAGAHAFDKSQPPIANEAQIRSEKQLTETKKASTPKKTLKTASLRKASYPEAAISTATIPKSSPKKQTSKIKSPQPVVQQPKKIVKTVQQKIKEPEKEKERFTEQDIADVPFTPRSDDVLDQHIEPTPQGNPRSPLPGGIATQEDSATQITVQKSQPNGTLVSLRNKFTQLKDDHSRNIDNSDIDQIFHSYSRLADEEGTRELSIANAELAQQELFRKWDIDLTDQEQSLNDNYIKTYFKQLKEATGETTINVDKSEEFFRGITAQVLDGQNVQVGQEDQQKNDEMEQSESQI